MIQLHDVLRWLGRVVVTASVVVGFGFRQWDTAMYLTVLGAVLLWQGGFDFDDMSRRYE